MNWTIKQLRISGMGLRRGVFVLLLSFWSCVCFALTTRTWTGATNNNFNTATNWSPNAVPSSGDSCVISVSGNVTITLSGNITVGALYMRETGNAKTLTLDMVSYLLTISGNLHVLSSGNSSTDVYLDLGSSAGGVTVERHAFINDGGASPCFIISDVTSPGTFKFMRNLTVGSYGRTVAGVEPNMLFDGTGAQSVVINNIGGGAYYFLAETLTIGSANNPIVTLSGSGAVNGFGCYDGNVNINGSSIFDIGSKLIDRFASSGGTFSMAAGATLKIGSTNSFPAFYSTYSLNASSNTYYYGTTQLITALTYGNLYLSTSGTKTFNSSSTINGNLTTSGTVTADINAALDINGNVVIGAGTTVLGGSVTSTVAGNWTNSGTFTRETSTITFDGTGLSTVSAAASTFLTAGSTLMTESFENGGAIPGNWAHEIVTNGVFSPAVTFVSSSVYPAGFSASEGTYFARFNSYTASSGTQSRLKRTASFSSVGLTNIMVSFDWTNDNVYTNTDKVRVQFSTNGTTWTSAGSDIFRYTGAANTWTSQSVMLPVGAENQATLYVAFLFTSNYGNDCHLDNVVVTGGSVNEAYAGESFYNVKLNKTGAGAVTLASKIMIGTSLIFTGGNMNSTASFYPEFDEDAVVAGTPANTSHVNGTVLKRSNSATKFSFPVGDGSAYRYIAATPSNTSSTVWTVNYVGTGHPDTDVESSLQSIYTQEYWNVGRTGGTPADATLEVSWIPSTGVSDYSSLTIAHYDGTTDWDMIPSGAVGNNSAGVLTSVSAVSTFSPFTIGVINPVPLPISLLSFTGQNVGIRANKISWITASEWNNESFTLERTLDGMHFEEIGQLSGAGTSMQALDYFVIDADYPSDINYYRLKQTDYDGQFTYSPIVSIDNRIGARKISRIYNILGQEVSKDFKGAVIIVYSDNSVLRTVQN